MLSHSRRLPATFVVVRAVDSEKIHNQRKDDLATRETHPKSTTHPREAAPTHQTVEAVGTLKRWRNASAGTATVAAASLPLAISAHTSYGVGITSAVLAGALLALASHGLREVRLTTLVSYHEFA